MADDSEQIVEDYDFHPCNTPRSSKYYNTTVLTNYQQVRLNELKIEKVRENAKYLAAHPEIRALTALATRYILQIRPRTNLHEHLARFFSQRVEVLQRSVQEYIADQASHDVSKEDVWVNKIPEIILNQIIQRTFRSADDRPQAILNEIVERALNYADNSICSNLSIDNVKESISEASTLCDCCCIEQRKTD